MRLRWQGAEDGMEQKLCMGMKSIFRNFMFGFLLHYCYFFW